MFQGMKGDDEGAVEPQRANKKEIQTPSGGFVESPWTERQRERERERERERKRERRFAGSGVERCPPTRPA
mgnify:CR=1 FL=1